MSKQLAKLETEIELGVRAVGKALMEIREKKLYRDQYKTFELYCKDRWGFSDRHARTLIDSENVRAKIGTIVPVSDLKTSHLSEISKIPEKQQAQAAAEVLEQCEAEGRQPTAKDFKKAAKQYEVKPDPEPDLIDEVTGGEYEDVDDEPDDTTTETGTGIFDSKDWEVPKAYLPAHQARLVWIAINKDLAAIRRRIKAHGDHPGGERINASNLNAELKAVESSIRLGMFDHLCDICIGSKKHNGGTCKACRGVGFVGANINE